MASMQEAVQLSSSFALGWDYATKTKVVQAVSHWVGTMQRRRKSTGQYITVLFGEGAEEVLQAIATSLEKAKKRYCDAIETFEAYFRVKRNVIYERARFNSRNQLEGEPVEYYVPSLHSLARNCEYDILQEELIRDRIVIGI